MKIISKFKDYYDYLTGVYGIDKTKILDRTKFTKLSFGVDKLKLIFCNKMYIRYTTDYWFKLLQKEGCIKYWKSSYMWPHRENTELILSAEQDYIWVISEELGSSNLPYIVNYYSNKWEPFPILKEIHFDRVMTPQETYLKIEEFISKKDLDISLDPTDLNRFESKGFDKKKSFRKNQHNHEN